MTHHATTNDRPVTITSESVSEGHPDKVCDYIADSILDAYLAEDPHSRVACEVLCKCNLVVVAGEISSLARIDYERVVREAIGQIGYSDRELQLMVDWVKSGGLLTDDQIVREVAEALGFERIGNRIDEAIRRAISRRSY
jgi:S-adenosylmethionine synthetase